MNRSDLQYYADRAICQLALAQRARKTEASSAHLRLAQLHLARLRDGLAAPELMDREQLGWGDEARH
ncbi:hypothetical protein CLG96_04535 [Sphingomonas oleivorans]|uniref:Uncharacterized protein n=1 Tax=Sphingomonas oleivorans TaxID=1735121 RepID=A0A2T5G2J6_9SPHN|nr:hypothetical protein [Sphingomonas oleivorans]PTQ13369.1 hypothetical protein CLG96_04535 [Sphingomonas oleivorans]